MITAFRKGKLSKIIDQLCAKDIEPTEEELAKGKKELHLSYLLDPSLPEIHIDILFCMATQKAQVNIGNNLDKFLKNVSTENGINIYFTSEEECQKIMHYRSITNPVYSFFRTSKFIYNYELIILKIQ